MLARVTPLEARRTPPRGAVLAYAGTRHRAWRTALAWLDRAVEADGDRAWLLVSDDRDLAAVRERVQSSVGEGQVRAASGPPVPPHGDHRASWVEAERLLHACAGPVVGYDDAGLLQALLAVPAERAEWFVQRHLGPVLDRPELIETLRVWLATRGSRQAASQALHLHRNSVGYRVGQLKALLGVDPLEVPHAAVLQAALAALDLLRAGPSSSAVLRPDHASEQARDWR